MLDEFRSTNITWDKATSRIYSPVTANASDENGRKLVVQVVNGGQVEDLTGASLHLYWETIDKLHDGLDVFKAVDLKKGEFELSYTTGMLSNKGVLNANLVLIYTVGRVVSERFKITVTEGIDNDAIQSENSFSSLTQALIDVSNLEQNYAPRLNDLTAQLQQTTEFLNQLQNIINSEKLTPLFIENMASFGWVGMGVPTGIANYDGGNFFLKISGNAGDDFVTVTEGNITHAGTGKWAAVLKNDKGEWKTVAVTGSDGVNKLNIYPKLSENITSGEVGNLHDAVGGQHYTERGYFALAQHLYNAKPKNADRNKYIAKFKGTETTSNFAKIGGPYLNYNYVSNVSAGDILRSYTSNTLSPLLFGNGTTQGVEWTQNINGKKGFFEAFVGSHADDLTAEFYLDGVLSDKVDNFGAVVKRLVFDYENAETATFKVYATTQTVDKRLYISECTWWITELDHSTQLIPPHSKVVYLGDSWGEFHDKAMSRELSRLITKDSYKTVDVINPSVGGMTSAWGLSWFEEYVIKERPTHVFIEFFTNDLNDTPNTFTGPDGVSYSGRVTQAQWKENVLKMAELAIRYGIQPIIVTPAPTAVINQTQRHANANAYLMAGNSL